MKWERIDDILTEEGVKNLKAGKQGDVLMFDYEGSPLYLKVRRKDKDGAIWAERLDPGKFLKPEQADNEVEIISNKK
jgi:hypothetical protein